MVVPHIIADDPTDGSRWPRMPHPEHALAAYRRQSLPRASPFLRRSAYLFCIGNFARNGYAGRDRFLDDSGLNEEIDWKCRVTYTHSFVGPSIKWGVLGYAGEIGQVGYTREEVA